MREELKKLYEEYKDECANNDMWDRHDNLQSFLWWIMTGDIN